VPLVQAAVKNVIPESDLISFCGAQLNKMRLNRSKLAFNLNADEAAVMGAALQGAGLSAQFKTKDIRVDDKSPFGVEVTAGWP
jgi:molecular chaperone DnaK (HSP70)